MEIKVKKEITYYKIALLKNSFFWDRESCKESD
jgi:hypothetical protein